MIIVVAAVVTLIAVAVAVVKVMMWVETIGNMEVEVGVLMIDVLSNAEIIVAGAIVIVLKFALPVSYSVDASSSAVAVDSCAFVDALAGVILAVLVGIGFGVIPDVISNEFAFGISTLDLPMSTPEFGL